MDACREHNRVIDVYASGKVDGISRLVHDASIDIARDGRGDIDGMVQFIPSNHGQIFGMLDDQIDPVGKHYCQGFDCPSK